MIVGINLETERESSVAVLGENLDIYSVETNEDIVEALPEEVQIVAVNAPIEPVEGLTEQEEELIEEGFQFTPSTQNKDLNRRAVHLKQLMFEKGFEAELIRFDEMVSSRELAIDGDQALESYGIDTSSIENAGEFDAVVGAVTGRFYQEDQCRDLGVQVPEGIKENT